MNNELNNGSEMAASSSVFGRLDDSGSLLRQIVGSIVEDETYYSAGFEAHCRGEFEVDNILTLLIQSLA